MEILNPQAEITNALLHVLPLLNVDTYFYLPQEEVEYPFIVVGEQLTSGIYTKDRPTVSLTQVIHVYALADELPYIQRLVKLIEATVYNLQKTENFNWVNTLDENILLMDDSTKDQLWHAALTFSCNSN
ncbi:DUF3168 domain-containing protein [Lactococcus ileimucosae]|uniref:DUF3168 domain-containing protein n=1 Tax=Lactococcus ileimucosae TaxID=2941329 RepID=A0ABV4D1D5_9LACT|nr:DUF3168 domain-containing protein [Lactococcus ileimucosae]